MEPVGVATIIPSARISVAGVPSMDIAKCLSFAICEVCMTVSFVASSSRFPSTTVFSFSRVSMEYFFASRRVMAVATSSGCTSVRKPRTPAFTPSIGRSVPCRVLRMVPSPPMVMMTSTFIFASGTPSPPSSLAMPCSST